MHYVGSSINNCKTYRDVVRTGQDLPPFSPERAIGHLPLLTSTAKFRLPTEIEGFSCKHQSKFSC